MRQSPLAEALERAGCCREGLARLRGAGARRARTHRDARCVRPARRGKASPQQPGHPSAAGFFQPEHPAGSAVIYGKRFLTRGFFLLRQGPTDWRRQSCSQRRSEGEEEAGAEGHGGVERTEGETGTETLQRCVSYN